MNLDALFYPQSIAVIGASDNLGGGRVPYFQVQQVNGYAGRLYPVNSRRPEVSGVKAYPTIDDLPEPVDYAIVAAPVEQSIDIVKAAVRRGVKFIHFFTSGFGETGNLQMEKDMVREARKGNLRIIGPNCIGVQCFESKMSFKLMNEQEEPGTIAFLGQSGGITSSFASMATTRRIWLNKVVSYGNQIDLRLEDYIEYLGDDDKIRLIACYVEDIKDVDRFLKTLKRTTAKKPVMILKGGKTEEGSKAAASHTGAMASNYTIWAAAVKQNGGLLVDNMDRLMNLAMLGTAKKFPGGRRIGFLGAGGGVSVLFTDLAVASGCEVPELEPATQKMISEKIRGVNTSTINPVDLGAFGFDLNVMLHTMQAMDQDDNIDVIIPYFDVEYLVQAEMILQIKNSADTIRKMAECIKKPVIAVLVSFLENSLDAERIRIDTFASLRKAGFPVYRTIQEAVYAIETYFEWAEKRSSRLK